MGKTTNQTGSAATDEDTAGRCKCSGCGCECSCNCGCCSCGDRGCGGRCRCGRTLRKVVTLAAVVLITAAVVQELDKPKSERTWRGRVFGKVPYDLRVPTPQRLVASLWRPEEHRVFVDKAFGVGWDINAARIVELIKLGRVGTK